MFVIMQNDIPVCVSELEDKAFTTALNLIQSEFCGNTREQGVTMLFI